MYAVRDNDTHALPGRCIRAKEEAIKAKELEKEKLREEKEKQRQELNRLKELERQKRWSGKVKKKWSGPAKGIGNDGKVLFIKYGNNLR